MKLVSYVSAVSGIVILTALFSCSSMQGGLNQSRDPEVLSVNLAGQGTRLELLLSPGKSHNHPSFVIWAETLDEQFIQTLFVTKSVGTGVYGHGSVGPEKWDSKSGPQSRPASLPYWLHKRLPEGAQLVLPNPDQPVPDAYTGATPLSSAKLNLKMDSPKNEKYRILLEINQPWDWNEKWHSTLLDDPDYRTSCQPSLIYAVTIDPNQKGKVYTLNPIGHGHPTGKTGELNTDLTTLSTAKDILSKAQITIQ